MCVLLKFGDGLWAEIDDIHVCLYAGKCVCDGWNFVCVCVLKFGDGLWVEIADLHVCLSAGMHVFGC